jgi:hypothetical protein
MGATMMFSLWAWIVSLVWPSPFVTTWVKLVVPPLLCLALLRLWVILRT